jgi:hypothetical protein
MISSNEIERTIESAQINFGTEMPDENSIRAAYEWIDAQTKTKHLTNKNLGIRPFIKVWAGRHISELEVMVAGLLHPEIIGERVRFNISSRLTLPSTERLVRLGLAVPAGGGGHTSKELYYRKEEWET